MGKSLLKFTNNVTGTIDYPVGIYLLKFNNRNTRARCEICSKLKIKTPVSFLLTRTHFTPCSSVSIVNFEQVIAGWVKSLLLL